VAFDQIFGQMNLSGPGLVQNELHFRMNDKHKSQLE